ncbi:DUF6011 domain-containing protein [Planococcus halotolerans]|uniref:DUF6011 domain-containing protein n=1 Tax=Planococcus halotolerans TaxID=2233542 RepID=UPI0014020259|nr:DUF6011 domain-containing protein [Planococcus halotolerans]
METCKRCNRQLKTVKSIDVGYGPTCKKKQDEADAEFLRIQITMEEELEYQKKVKR